MIRFKKILFFAILLMAAFQPHGFSQIINEKKLTSTPFESILQFSDNDYIYIGTETYPDSYENGITLIRKNLNGEIIWKKTIKWGFNCTVRDAVILSDKSIIIAGSARKSTYQSYPFVMKTDQEGDTIWARYYETGLQAEDVIGTSDGGYLFSYYLHGSGLTKLNSNGGIVWSQMAGKGRPYGLAETSEAVYLLVDDEGDNIVLSSIDSGGEILWKRTFGGPGRDQPADVINAFNGDDYLFAGRSYSYQTGEDFIIGLLDCFGYVQWTKTFGGTGTDLCYDLMQSSDGNFLAVGSSNSFNKEGRVDFYILKFDTYGNTIWEKTFPGIDNQNYRAQNVFETSYGSLLLSGPKLSGSTTTEESYLVEFVYPTQFDISFETDRRELSNPPYYVEFTNNTSNAEYFDFVWYFGDGESLASNDKIISHEYTENGLYDVKLVAFENDFGSVDSLVNEDYIRIEGISTSVNYTEANQNHELNIYPNPFRHKTNISFSNPHSESFTLRIMDQSGKVVKEMNNLRGSSVELRREGLSPGIYFAELKGSKTVRARLLVL